MSKKITSAFILAALVLSLFACTQQDTPSGSESNAETTAPVTESETDWLETLPEGLDYTGKTFNVMWASPFDVNEIELSSDEFEADIVDDAVYQRKLLVEDRIGITLESTRIGSWWGEAGDNITQTVLSGDNTYSAYCGSIWYGFLASMKDELVNLYGISSLDLDQKWWDNATKGMYNFGSDSIYQASGDINYLDDYGLAVLAFNKTLCAEYGLGSPYDEVRGGTWTLDMLNAYIKDSYRDNNGDGNADFDDSYGYVFNQGNYLSMINAFGQTILAPDANHIITLNSSEALINRMDRLFETIYAVGNKDVAIVSRGNATDAWVSDLFTGGRVLFADSMLGWITSTYRNSGMEDDFGIIPFPKYDEEQKDYYASINVAWATAYSVLKSCPDTEMAGYVMDVMSYYSRDTIYTASIERNVLTKNVRDEDSAEMIEMMYNLKMVDFGGWGCPTHNPMCSLVPGGNNNVVSMFEAQRNPVEAQFAAFSDFYKFKG